MLFPPSSWIPADQRPLPDWGWVHRELRRPDVTLALLWEEYRAGAADGFSYSWFCDLYRAWAGRLKPTMPQIHLAGDKLSVDFAGRAGEVIDAVPVRIFVAVPPGQPATWHAPAGTHRCAEVARCRAHPYGRS